MAYNAFDFHFPTHILFGAGESRRAHEAAARYAKNGVFLVTYADFRLPVVDGLLAGFAAMGLPCTLYAEAVPNPRAEDVASGAARYLASGADFILGVGGGSVIDTAKGIALLAANPSDGGVWDYVSFQKQPQNAAMPLGLVVSIASTGSESNESMVLTAPDGKQKLIYSHPSLRPLFSVCDPELSYTLPAKQTALGAADIFSHALEQYLHRQEGTELSDDLALALMRTVVYYAPLALTEPANADARANLMWASILAMSRLLGVGHAENWVCHMLEHAVSAEYDLPHAAGMTALLPAYLAFIRPYDDTDKLPRLAKTVFGQRTGAEDAIGLIRNFFAALGLPVNLYDALGHGVSEESYAVLAKNAIPWGAMDAGLYPQFTQADAETVYRRAFMTEEDAKV